MTRTEQAVERTAGPRYDQAIASAGNSARPFYSIGCTLMDLGSWLDDIVRGPGPPRALPDWPVCSGPGRTA